jgi:hypothetical protein
VGRNTNGKVGMPGGATTRQDAGSDPDAWSFSKAVGVLATPEALPPGATHAT